MQQKIQINENGEVKLIHEYSIVRQEDILKKLDFIFPYILNTDTIYFKDDTISYYGICNHKKIVSCVKFDNLHLKTYYKGLEEDFFYPCFKNEKETIIMDIEYKPFENGYSFYLMIEHHANDVSMWDYKKFNTYLYYSNGKNVYVLPLPNTFSTDKICMGDDKNKLNSFNVEGIFRHIQTSIWNEDLLTDSIAEKAKVLFKANKKGNNIPEQYYINSFSVLNEYMIKPEEKTKKELLSYIKIIKKNEKKKDQ